MPPRDASISANDNGEAGTNSELSTIETPSMTGPLFAQNPSTSTNVDALIGASTPLFDGSFSINNPVLADATLPNQSRLRSAPEVPERTKTPEVFSAHRLANLELVCPIDAGAISNRWLNSYIPAPGQKNKEYSKSTASFIFRILKSYASVTVHGRAVPPFIHPAQTKAAFMKPPLATCLAIVRMCKNPLPGSEGTILDVLQREMNSLYNQRELYDDMSSLTAFQAYLIYSMVLFFLLKQNNNLFLRQAIMNLQELACSSSHRGLVCKAEQQHARPQWEAWIVAEAKRRTLYTMYFFDNVLSTQDGIPITLGSELQGLPAPTSQYLWRAETRYEWEEVYNLHLTDWTDYFRIDELWPLPTDLDDHGVAERRGRVDRWLEGVDEFGTMLYAVTSSTHGT